MNAWPEPVARTLGRELVIGTRGSELALAQAAIVCDALRSAHPDIELRIERITTTGDARHDVPLSQLGRGMFVKEIEAALLDGRIDLAVHSAKDLPSVTAPGLTLGAIMRREDARDVLVSRHGALRELRAGARIGTSSPRRACELRARRPDVEPVDIRGNVDTRLRKLAAGDFDALVMAAAGLIRLHRVAEVTEWLDPDEFIPSVGQGAIAVEVRADDENALQYVRPLDDAPSRAAVTAERAFLAELGAGCQAAAAAHATVDTAAGELRIAALIGTIAGNQVRACLRGSIDRAQPLGVEIAHHLLVSGGAQFLAKGNSALCGAVVAITRPADRSAELIALLRAHGAQPVVCPTIATQPLRRISRLDAALFNAAPPRWIAFTSVNAVEAVADYLVREGRRLPEGVRLSAVGDATARAVERRFRWPDFIPSAPNAETLGVELPDVAAAAVLFPRGDLAADTLSAGLSARGAVVCDVVVYRTTAGPGVDDLAAHARTGRLDAAVFASPSSLRFAIAALDGFHTASHEAPVVVCIGPTTARTARELGLQAVEAPSASVGGIVDVLERSLRTRRGADVEHADAQGT